MKNHRHPLSFILTPVIALATLSACGADDRILIGEILDELRGGSPNPTGSGTMEPPPTGTMEPTPSPTEVPTGTPEPPSMQELIAQRVLDENCSGCHNAELFTGGLASVAFDDLIDNGKVIPGNADQSLIIARMRRDEMPPAGVERRPSSEEIERVADFIDSL